MCIKKEHQNDGEWDCHDKSDEKDDENDFYEYYYYYDDDW